MENSSTNDSGRYPGNGNRLLLRSRTVRAGQRGVRAGSLILALCIVLVTLAVLPGTVAALPDLRISTLSPNLGGPTANTVFIKSYNPVIAKVINSGSDASPEAVLLINSTDGFSGTASIPALASGSFEFIEVVDTNIRQTSGGTIKYTGTVDPDNLIIESNETNNVVNTDNLPIRYNGYKGKALYSDNGGNVSTKQTYDIHGGFVQSFGDSYYRSGSFSGGWTTYDVTWKYNPSNASSPEFFELVVPANATVHAARLYIPYTWDYPNATTGQYDMPDNVVVTFNGNTINYQQSYWDRGNFGTYADYTYGLLSYDVTSLYQKNATNTLHFERPGNMDKLSLYGMTLMVVYDNPAEPRRQIFLNEEFDLLGAAPNEYYTTVEEATAYVPFSGMTIDTSTVKRANLTTFVPSGDGWEGNLLFNGLTIATDVWNYGAEGQPVGENGFPQVATDVRDVKNYLTTTGNEAGIQSTIRESTPCMAASQQILEVEYYSPPVAAFAADRVLGSAPMNVTFTDQSTGDPASWAWDFGDGNTSTEQNPVHQYAFAGNFTVTLTATNIAGSDSETKTDYITVSDAPVPLPLPGYSNPPTDPDSDGLYEDLNANGRKDFGDVVLFSKNYIWIKANEPVSLFDFNLNGRIDQGDIVTLNKELSS